MGAKISSAGSAAASTAGRAPPRAPASQAAGKRVAAASSSGSQASSSSPAAVAGGWPKSQRSVQRSGYATGARASATPGRRCSKRRVSQLKATRPGGWVRAWSDSKPRMAAG